MDDLLKNIHSPEDLRRLSPVELARLPQEIRNLLIDTISQNGGHLAPNLGTVELTIALHMVFHTPEDKIVWDVGHQSYTHKILTGRAESFHTLRQKGGISGFTRTSESPHDCFGSGHSGTALSAAMGIESATELRGSHERVIAVVGDGALGCGISLEALNNLSSTCRRFILILNDNKMAISRSKGAVARILKRIIIAKSYNRFKHRTKKILNKIHTERLIAHIQSMEQMVKGALLPGFVFEEVGLRYVGPVDGHNLTELIQTFESIRDYDRPAIVHVLTEKGHGCTYAEESPELFHGIGRFDPETGEVIKSQETRPTFSATFGAALANVLDTHPETVAVCAAMALGCGLDEAFRRKYHDRFFDTGIAEEHAVAFAAGLAANGCRPIAVIYATFAQRALDCIYHDVCLQNLPLILCEDRAGIVEDGPTHHGIYDVSFLRAMPNLSILQPASESELPMMLEAALAQNSPVVIRYPKGNSGCPDDYSPSPIVWGRADLMRSGEDLSIWCSGAELWTGIATAEILQKEYGVSAAVISARFLKPFDAELFARRAGKPVVTIEDHVKQGGLASAVAELASNAPSFTRVISFGWDADKPVPHGNTKAWRKELGMTADAIAEKIASELKFAHI